MKVIVLQSGAIKDNGIVQMCAEFEKRFRRFGSLEIRCLKRLEWPDRCYRILCDERGKTYTSVDFAKRMQQWHEQHGTVALAIGDAYGFTDEFAAAAQHKIRLSDFTLPHQMAHLIAVEQCYRAATIVHGLPYHHA